MQDGGNLTCIYTFSCWCTRCRFGYYYTSLSISNICKKRNHSSWAWISRNSLKSLLLQDLNCISPQTDLYWFLQLQEKGGFCCVCLRWKPMLRCRTGDSASSTAEKSPRDLWPPNRWAALIAGDLLQAIREISVTQILEAGQAYICSSRHSQHLLLSTQPMLKSNMWPIV